MSGSVWVLVGPSGSGKTSLAKELPTRMTGLSRAVTCTTRQPRPGERDGVDYRFVTDSAFDDLLADDGLVEWTHYGSARYGLPADQFENLAGGDLVCVLDLAGVHHLRERLGSGRVQAVYLASPPPAVLAARMRERGSTPSEIAERLELVADEQNQASECDHRLDTSLPFEEVLAQLQALVAQTRRR